MTPDCLHTLHYETGSTYAIAVRRRLADTRSDYQHVIVVDTEAFGRCLILDGVMQTAESDHLVYDDALLRRLRADDRRILVVGGGDGYVARRVVTRAPAARVLVIDIDPVVVELADSLLNPGLFGDPRVELRIGDGRAEARTLLPGSFDGVALDLTDIPLDPQFGDDPLALFRDMLAATRPLVRPGGWLSAQGGPSRTAGVDLSAALGELLAAQLVDLVREDVFLPSYAEENAFFHGVAP